MPVPALPKQTQDTLSFIGEHEGVTAAFITILVLLIAYLYKEYTDVKKDKSKVLIEGLQMALDRQRETIDSTLGKLDTTVGKLERTITDLSAELFRDMHGLDRRLSKLEGEHSARKDMRQRSSDHSEDCSCIDCEGQC